MSKSTQELRTNITNEQIAQALNRVSDINSKLLRSQLTAEVDALAVESQEILFDLMTRMGIEIKPVQE